jgi:hypothetical protein
VFDNNQHHQALLLARKGVADVADSGYLHQGRRMYQLNGPYACDLMDLGTSAQCRYPMLPQDSSSVLSYSHRDHRHDVEVTTIVSARKLPLDSRGHGLWRGHTSRSPSNAAEHTSLVRLHRLRSLQSHAETQRHLAYILLCLERPVVWQGDWDRSPYQQSE